MTKNKAPTVCISMPVVYGVQPEAYFSHLSLAIEVSRIANVVIPQIANIFPCDAARELAVGEALIEKCDYFLSCDSDLVIPPGSFGRLYDAFLNAKALDPRIMMAAGWYVMRKYPYSSIWTIPDPTDPNGQLAFRVDCPPGTTENVDLAAMGMGFNLIDVQWCLNNLKRPWFSFEVLPSGKHIYEDTYFCNHVREVGGRMIGVPTVRLGHLSECTVVDDSNSTFLRQQYLKAQSGL